jgi:hypothetical protein
MAAQEALSMMPGSILKSAALLVLALSVGLLLFANGVAFRAGYEEARRSPRGHVVGPALAAGYEDGSRTKRG